MGMHLTSPVVHSSGRTVVARISARAVALFGHFGIEWDLTTVDDETRERDRRVGRARQAPAAARSRPGRTVDVDGTDPGIDVRGIVAADAASAVFTITQTETTRRLPAGADPDAGARPRPPLPRARPRARRRTATTPGQSAARVGAPSDTILTGRELAAVGLRPPVQFPQQSTVVELDRRALTTHPHTAQGGAR